MSALNELHEAAWRFDRFGIEGAGGFPAPNPDAPQEPTGCQGCGEPDARPLKLVTFRREHTGPWYLARWCPDCLDMGRLAFEGAESFGACGLEPVTALVVWTEHTFQCRSCKRHCRASESVIAQLREDYAWDSPDPSDAEVAAALDLCLWCTDDEVIPGEHLYGAPPRGEPGR